ncbi:MAG TPA: TolC family protein [Methylophilaceae bacterium]|nr:TolC family protein [Methylophilaceae bacterium]HQC29226.1 TolC family protein [Methylotenera sp.]
MQYCKFALCGALLSLLFTGCATFSNDGGLADVQALTAPHLKQDVVWPKDEASQNVVTERVRALLKAPLNADSAVQIALLNNKGLQASLYALGIAEADVVQAGRLPNPKFSMLYARHQGEYKIEQALTFNIFSLLAMPKVLEIERRNFEKTKQAVAIDVLNLANETRAAYFNAVAANELLRYSEQVKESAEASAVLAQRMVAAGNWSTLEQAREQGFYVDAMLEYTSAQQMQNRAHASLARLLGVSAEQLQLEKRLPDLPKTASELQPLEKTAFEQRLDLQALRLDTTALAKQLGLTKTTRFINVLEIGPARVLEGRRGDAYKKGVDIAFELPLFDWGDAKVARAEAIYMQSVHHAAQMASNAQSEVREAYNHYLTTYEMAKHYRDDIVPMRKKILTENQLRYNGMLVSPFELFADARAQVASVKAYINTLNEFWLAETALNRALIGKPASLEGK